MAKLYDSATYAQYSELFQSFETGLKVSEVSFQAFELVQ